MYNHGDVVPHEMNAERLNASDHENKPGEVKAYVGAPASDVAEDDPTGDVCDADERNQSRRPLEVDAVHLDGAIGQVGEGHGITETETGAGDADESERCAAE